MPVPNQHILNINLQNVTDSVQTVNLFGGSIGLPMLEHPFYTSSEGTPGEIPTAIAYNPVNGFIYAINSGSTNVTTLSPSGIVSSFGAGLSTAIAINPVNGKIYVGDNTGDLYIFDSNATPITTIGLGSGINEIFYHNGNMYVSVSSPTNTVEVIDGSDASIATISVGTQPTIFAYSSTNDRLYVVNQNSNNVSVINPNTNTVVATVAVGNTPNNIEFSPASGMVYVNNSGASTTSVINSSNVVVSTLSLGGPDSDLFYNPVNQRLYIMDINANNLAVLNSSNQVVGRINVFSQNVPSMSVDESTGYMYVSNGGDNGVNVYDQYDKLVGVSTISTVFSGPDVYSFENGKTYAVDGFTSESIFVLGPTVVVTTSGSNSMEFINNSIADNPIKIQGLQIYTPDTNFVYPLNYGFRSEGGFTVIKSIDANRYMSPLQPSNIITIDPKDAGELIFDGNKYLQIKVPANSTLNLGFVYNETNPKDRVQIFPGKWRKIDPRTVCQANPEEKSIFISGAKITIKNGSIFIDFKNNRC